MAADPKMRFESIVVTFDSEETIAECLASLRRWAPGSITVVDNASADNTVALAQGACDRLIQMKANAGYAAALNGAISQSEAEFVLIVNPDLRLENSIEPLVEAIGSAARRIAGPSLRDKNGIQYACARPLPTPWRLLVEQLRVPLRIRKILHIRDLYYSDWNHEVLRQVPALSGACFLIRREFWVTLQGMSCDGFLYFEDIDFFARVEKAAGECWYVPAVVAFHHGGASSRTVEQEPRMRLFLGAWLLFAYRHQGHVWVWRAVLVLGQLVRAVGSICSPDQAGTYLRRIWWIITVDAHALAGAGPLTRTGSPT